MNVSEPAGGVRARGGSTDRESRAYPREDPVSASFVHMASYSALTFTQYLPHGRMTGAQLQSDGSAPRCTLEQQTGVRATEHMAVRGLGMCGGGLGSGVHGVRWIFEARHVHHKDHVTPFAVRPHWREVPRARLHSLGSNHCGQRSGRGMRPRQALRLVATEGTRGTASDSCKRQRCGPLRT